MGAGKPLAALAGILVLAATFGLTLFFNVEYGSGIGLILNIVDIFTNPTSYGAEAWLVYLLAILFIVFLLAGIFLLVGIKNRGLAIVGALLALGISLYVLLGGYAFSTGNYLSMFESAQLVVGIFPYHLGLGGTVFEVGLGAWVLLGGGVLGLISGILGRD